MLGQSNVVASRRSCFAPLTRRPHHRPAPRRPAQVCMVFTGIVQGLAEVVDVKQLENLTSIRVQLPSGKADGVQLGASVAINGTCLTVTDMQGDKLGFDMMFETLRATNLGDLALGSRVNFERAARIGDEVGGHNVSGHVHFKASVSRVDAFPNNRKLTFKVPDKSWMKYILPKGYIAVDGCSLTIGEVDEDTFTVYLIPETLRITVFGFKQEGDTVNVEIETQTQVIVDTVEKVVARHLERFTNLTAPA